MTAASCAHDQEVDAEGRDATRYQLDEQRARQRRQREQRHPREPSAAAGRHALADRDDEHRGEGDDRDEPDEDRGHRGQSLAAPRRSLCFLDELFGASREGRVRRHDLVRATFHLVGEVDAEQVEQRRSDVDRDRDTVVLRRRGADVARTRTRCAQGGHGQLAPALGRPDDHDRVAVGIDLREQPPEHRVGVAERGGTQRHELLRGGEPHVAPEPGEVRCLDEHDAAFVALVPRLVERVDHAVRIELHAERRGGIGGEQHVSDLAVLDDPRAVDQRQCGLAVAVVGTRPVDAVGVRDHGPVHVVLRELVGDRTELDVVRQRRVLPAQRGEAQRHDAALRIASGAALEHFAGGDVADHLLGVELIAVDAGQPDTTRPRAERHVGVGRAGSVRDDARRGQARQRRSGEKPFEVREVDRVELAPRHARHREDEDAADRRRIGRGRCRRVEYAVRSGEHAGADEQEHEQRDEPLHAEPARPRSSNARNGGTRAMTPLNDTNSDARLATNSTIATTTARRRRGFEDDGETEDRAEHVRAGVAEHEVLAKVIGQERQSGARDDGRRHAGRAGTADEDDRHVAEHRELGRSAGRAVEQVCEIGRERDECRVDEGLHAGTPGRRRGQRERERGTSRRVCRGRSSLDPDPTRRGDRGSRAHHRRRAGRRAARAGRTRRRRRARARAPRPATRHRSRAHRLRRAALRRR